MELIHNQTKDMLYYEILHFNSKNPIVLYIHGGPGGHSAPFRDFVINNAPESFRQFNWVFYDQRGCGYSKECEKIFTHEQNILDLKNLIYHLYTNNNIILSNLIGHSYGGWLGFDYLVQTQMKANLVVLAMNEDLEKPKLNQLYLNILMLKMQNPKVYNKIYPEICRLKEDAWDLYATFKKDIPNPNQKVDFFFWANPLAQNIFNKIKLNQENQDNDEVFFQVRKSIFDRPILSRFIKQEKINGSLLRIVGYHDFVMNGADAISQDNTEVFFGSSHYPHIEEPEIFIKHIKDFICG